MRIVQSSDIASVHPTPEHMNYSTSKIVSIWNISSLLLSPSVSCSEDNYVGCQSRHEKSLTICRRLMILELASKVLWTLLLFCTLTFQWSCVLFIQCLVSLTSHLLSCILQFLIIILPKLVYFNLLHAAVNVQIGKFLQFPSHQEMLPLASYPGCIGEKHSLGTRLMWKHAWLNSAINLTCLSPFQWTGGEITKCESMCEWMHGSTLHVCNLNLMLGSSQSTVIMLLLVPLTFDLNYWAVNKFVTGMMEVCSKY